MAQVALHKMKVMQKQIYGKIIDGFLGMLLYPLRLFVIAPAAATQLVLNQIVSVGGDNLQHVTIDSIFFNELKLVDINIFDDAGGSSDIIKNIRSSISYWYVSFRNLAFAFYLAVLVYIGIRMAINSIAEDRAKYKSMLINWLVGLAILTFLHFFIVFVLNVNSKFVAAFSVGKATEDYMSTIFTSIWTAGFIRSMGLGILYTVMSVIVFIYLVVYIKRMLMVCFLIMIAPLISITYAIDKSGNNKSEILNTWVKTFSYNVLIQPFHCILYMIFVNQSIDLMNTSSVFNIGAAVFSVICMFGIFIGEKIIKNIFGFNKGNMVAGKLVASTILTKSITTIRQQVENIKNLNQNEGSNPDYMPDGTTTQNVINKNTINKNIPEEDEVPSEPTPEPSNREEKKLPAPIRAYGNMVATVTGAKLVYNAGSAIKSKMKRKPSNEELFKMASEKYRQSMDPDMSDRELARRMQLLANTNIKDLTDGRDIAYKMWIDSTKKNLENQGDNEQLDTMKEMIVAEEAGVIVGGYEEKEQIIEEEEEEIPVSSITIEPAIVNLKEGDSIVLTATISPANATNKNVTWASKNEAIATVDELNDSGDAKEASQEQKARVVAIKEGTIQIEVSAFGESSSTITSTCKVIVKPR